MEKLDSGVVQIIKRSLRSDQPDQISQLTDSQKLQAILKAFLEAENPKKDLSNASYTQLINFVK